MKSYLLPTRVHAGTRAIPHPVWFRGVNAMFLASVAVGLAFAISNARADSVTLGAFEVDSTRILAKVKDPVVLEKSREPFVQLGSAVHHQYSLVPGLVVLEETNTNAKAAVRAASEQSQRDRLLKRIDALKKSGLFDYAEPDYIVRTSLAPSDSAYTDGTLWGLHNFGQNSGKVGADISAPAAWNLTTGSTNVIVAVIDTGIWYTHHDLTNQMWRNPNPGSFPGFTNDIFGINAINGTGDPKDDFGHGTHVSGTIGAAANDGNPMVGVTWHVQLMGCKFLDAQGSGRTSDAITCINYAVFNKARILNNSWGGGGFSSALLNSIYNAGKKGVLFVAAAGNAANNNDTLPFYPATYPLDNIISVAALDRADNLAYFSNYGLTTVHLGAPGVEIFSCFYGSDTAYAIEDGTSMAAPHVSGVAALVLSLYPSADLTELRQRLLLGTVPIGSLTVKTITGGRANAYNSLTISGSGVLRLSADPPSSSTLLSGSAQPIFVKASDLFSVNTATVTGTFAGITNLAFANNGLPPDLISNDGVYSAIFQVPVSSTNRPITLSLTGSAPGKYGATNVLVNYTIVPPPPNDFFTNAIKVPAAGTTYLSNNRFATMEPNEPAHGGDVNAAASLWWAWSALNNTNVLIDTAGSTIDTVVAVYSGNTLTNLQPIASTNSNLTTHQPAMFTFSAQAGQAYRIAAASLDTNGLGTIQLRVAPGGHADITPPDLFVGSPLNGSTVTDSVLDVSGTAVDPAPDSTGVSEIFVSINGGIAFTAFGTTNWTAPIILQPGFNTIQVSAIDNAGNVSAMRTVQVDYLLPFPANDFFVNATPLTGASGTLSESNTDATKEVGEPNHAGNGGGKSLWWSFQAPADGVLTLNTTNSTFDTLLGLYAGTNIGNLTTIANNDDAYDNAPGGFSYLAQAVRSNQTYSIAIDGYDGGSGTAALQYSLAPATLFSLTVSSLPGGFVQLSTINPLGGIAVQPGGQADFASNSTVLLTAIPNPGYEFDSWDGDTVSVANPLSLGVQKDLALTAHFRSIAFTEDFESGTLTQLPWATAGDKPWFVQTNEVAFGQYSASSGPIADSQTSSLLLSTVMQSGSASFEYRVSSEPGWDFLRFFVDGTLLQQWSGEVGWTTYTFPVAAGSHTLEWRYVKDPSGSAGLDAAFIDNLSLPLTLSTNGQSAAHLQLERQVDGTFFLDILGQTNQTYVTQGSTNLVNWLNLSTNIANGGFIRIPDPAHGANQIQYYRAYVPQP